jgi:hypothetical protein
MAWSWTSWGLGRACTSSYSHFRCHSNYSIWQLYSVIQAANMVPSSLSINSWRPTETAHYWHSKLMESHSWSCWWRYRGHWMWGISWPGSPYSRGCFPSCTFLTFLGHDSAVARRSLETCSSYSSCFNCSVQHSPNFSFELRPIEGWKTANA